jgi:23S rRNA (adenine2030-N6)-methyltransferase
MNYRHAYHAGNHGDVLKHIVLARVLEYFKLKAAPFGVLDAHAGIGVYDVLGLEAFKTGEWKDGIGKVLQAVLADDVATLLSPYLGCVRALNRTEFTQYPGSPELCRQLMRRGDRLLLNELHPQDHETLAARYPGFKVEQVDALQVVKAHLPFLEKRGIVLVDPPYELTDETTRVAKMVMHALNRMSSVCMLIWYPVTTRAFADQFCAAIPVQGVKGLMRIELNVRKSQIGGGMAGSGLVVINPPWTLFEECKIILPALTHILAQDGWGQHKLEWLVQPK